MNFFRWNASNITLCQSKNTSSKPFISGNTSDSLQYVVGGLVLAIELFTWYAFIHIWHDGDKQASANDKTRIHFTVITLHLFIFYSDCMSHIKFSCYTHMIYHIIYLITSNISSIRRQKEPIINVLAPVQYIILYLYYLWRLLYLVTYHDKPFCWHKFVAWPWWHFDFELIAW